MEKEENQEMLEKKISSSDKDIEVSETKKHRLIFGVRDTPPWAVAIPFALQLCSTAVTYVIANAVLIGKATCASDLDTSKLISTGMFLGGFTTILQTTIGIRLPIYQGSSILYTMPIVARATLPDWACIENQNGNVSVPSNFTDSSGVLQQYVGWDYRIQAISGSLMVVSVIHAILGFTGVVGFFIRFIGPQTIVPALTILGLEVMIILRDLAEIHWGITAVCFVIVVICSCYLANVGLPLPMWDSKNGWKIVRPRIFRPFGMIISIIVGWLLCFILTQAGVFSNDPDDLEYKARTDNKGDVIDLASWFYFPYPGQFGAPRFNIGIFFGFIVAMITSILDSVADYIVTSKVCEISSPPPSAVNRGLFIEGMCSILSGGFGAGLATTTYSGIIGQMSLTGIASRRVFHILGILLMLLGIFGKFAAVFVIMPKPVVAGFASVGIASLIGMALSGLEEVDMNKPRNVICIGLSLMLGTIIPRWVRANPRDLETGIFELDQLLNALLSNGMFVGGFAGFFLDMTLPGKDKKMTSELEKSLLEESGNDDPDSSIYNLSYISSFMKNKRWSRFFPICPSSNKNVDKNSTV